MRFETSLAVEEIKESLAKSIREIDPPDMDVLTQVVWTDVIVEVVWSAIDKCVELMQLDTNYEIDSLKAKMISREFELTHIAHRQLANLCEACLKQIKTLAPAEQLETMIQACVDEFEKCAETMTAAISSESKERSREPTLAVVRHLLEECRHGQVTSAHILEGMVRIGICSHEELGTTPDEIAEFLRQKQERKQ